jgi:hypothetical protein
MMCSLLLLSTSLQQCVGMVETGTGTVVLGFCPRVLWVHDAHNDDAMQLDVFNSCLQHKAPTFCTYLCHTPAAPTAIWVVLVSACVLQCMCTAVRVPVGVLAGHMLLHACSRERQDKFECCLYRHGV